MYNDTVYIKLSNYLGIRDMDGNDGRMNVVRLNHLIEVAERFTQEEWRSSKVYIYSFDLLILIIFTTNVILITSDTKNLKKADPLLFRPLHITPVLIHLS